MSVVKCHELQNHSYFIKIYGKRFYLHTVQKITCSILIFEGWSGLENPHIFYESLEVYLLDHRKVFLEPLKSNVTTQKR